MLQQNFKRTYSLLALVFITLLTLAGCQSKPQGLTAERDRLTASARVQTDR